MKIVHGTITPHIIFYFKIMTAPVKTQQTTLRVKTAVTQTNWILLLIHH